MSKFGVSPAKENALFEKMAALGINESDLEEKFIRSQGPGGQNVNKVSTCVELTHIPTGLKVQAQKDRKQGINRFLARRSLVEKYEQEILQIKTGGDLRAEKIRKQKKRRKRRTKAKIEEPTA